MNRKRFYNLIGSVVLSAAAFLMASCAEDVVDIDLNSANPHIVIEGKVNGNISTHTVRITKTTDFYKPAEYPAVSGAVVTISDDNGGTETLTESTPGLYTSDSLPVAVGRTYNLSVKVEGMEYRASSIMNATGHIDSLALEIDNESEEQYIVHCYFKDILNVKEYYRCKLYINGEQYNKETYTYQDRLTDGNNIDAELWFNDQPIHNGDIIIVEAQTVDRAVYQYFTTLENATAEITDGTASMFSGTPANPTTNLSNNALGYFSAYTSSFDTLIVDKSKAIKK